MILSVIQAINGSAILTTAAFVCAALGTLLLICLCLDPKWIDEDRDHREATYTREDVKDFYRLLPVLLTANLAFSCLYNSMQYWYQQQACQMDVRIPSFLLGGFMNRGSSDLTGAAAAPQFAGSFFMIADCLGIVIATPIVLNWVNPAMERLRGGTPLGTNVKFGIGCLFGTLSVVLAIYMEQA